jgi:hypothetical protein
MSDWSLPPEALDWLSRRITLDHVVVELGSGEGSAQLASMCAALYSVEHDPEWLGRITGVNYIHAPLARNWYDPAAIERGLPAHYDCVIVDGPPDKVGRRSELLKHRHLFADVPFLFDDTHRPEEMQLAAMFAQERGKSFSVHYLTSGRSFATVGWESA